MKVRKFNENLYMSNPSEGDYVICKEIDMGELSNFLENNIGRIVHIKQSTLHPCSVHYNNIPDDIENCFLHNIRQFSRDEIAYFSKNRKDLESILVANKYNL